MINFSKAIFFSTLIALFVIFCSFAYGFEVNYLSYVSEKFNDNVLATSEDQRHDFITSLMIGLDIKYEALYQSIEFTSHIFQNIYYFERDLSNNSQDLDLSYTFFASNYDTIHIANKFEHHPEAQTFDDAFGRTAGRIGYYNNLFNIDYIKAFTGRFLSKLYYGNRYTRHMSGDQINSISNIAGISSSYLWSSTNLISTSYGYNHTSYDTGEANLEHKLKFEYQLFLTDQLNCIVRTGINYLKTYTKDFRYPFFYFSLTHNIDDDNTIAVTISKQTDVSTHTLEVVDKWRVATDFMRQILLEELFLNFNIFYGQGESITSAISYRLFGSSISFRYKITEEMSTSIEYTYTNNETIVEGADNAPVIRNQIELFFSATF